MLKEVLLNLYYRLPVIRDLREIRSSLQSLENRLTNGYASQISEFHLRDHPRYGDPRRMIYYESQICSQNGEDGIIHEIFRRIGSTTSVFAEVGVGNGRENNTAFLLSQGWNGFWIDADAGFLDAVVGREDLPEGCIRYRIGLATRENIAAWFRELGVPSEFDLLSLDIDQNTYYAWEGLRDFRPRVVVVEYNAALPSDVDWKVHYDPARTWDRTQNFGASLKALERLGRQLGYSLVGCDFPGVNAFFVRDDLVGDGFAGPFTAENHYEPPRYGSRSRRGHAPALLDRADESR